MSSWRSAVNVDNTRFTLTGWSVLSLLLTTALSSGLFTGLTLPLYTPRVNTVKQLVEGNYYWTLETYIGINDSALRDTYFNFENYWNHRFENRYKFMKTEELLSRAESDKKITFPVEVFEDDVVVVYIPSLIGQKCLQKFRLTKERFKAPHVTFGVIKHSPLLEPLTRMTDRFLEVGLLPHWKSQVLLRWPVLDTRHIATEQDAIYFTEPQPLHLNKLQPVFYLLLLGLAVAMIVFIVELIK